MCDVTTTEATSREIRRYHSPPDHVRRTFSAILCVCGYSRSEADDWRTVKRVLLVKGDDSLVSQMSRFDVTGMSQGRKKFLVKQLQDRLEGISAESIRRVSRPAVGYFLWAQSTLAVLVKATDTTKREKVSCQFAPKTTAFWNRHLRVAAYQRMLS